MTNQSPITVAALVALVAASLQAGVIPGRWDKVDTLLRGAEVVVTMTSGDQSRGTFQGSVADALFITDVEGRKVEIPKSGVRKVVRQPIRQDSAWNGAAIGAAAGFAGGVVTGLVWAAAQSEEGVGILVFGPIGLGVGLVVGYGIDRTRPGEDVLYRVK